eukprot:SAG11_NODE_794_length_7137_cov_45.288576_6_plen_78_part_00
MRVCISRVLDEWHGQRHGRLPNYSLAPALSLRRLAIHLCPSLGRVHFLYRATHHGGYISGAGDLGRIVSVLRILPCG